MCDISGNLLINPYFLFLAKFRENLKSRGVVNIKVTTVVQMASKKWRQMSKAQKAIYNQIAQMNRKSRLK
ncbi:uncharacterized protein LOC122757817 [Drosophila mojavensis]|uniref:uncharacterized protein LOC122757817 n=1 Tax=Drosophila mojavensis TaxID=7230 RepID=UPI001CD0C514|nr:uncharacterized protein LOC122757817 [Drosophila mojavensis]